MLSKALKTHHCLKSVWVLSLGFFPRYWPPFNKCWCRLILDLTKENWQKVFRQQEHVFLLPNFFMVFILKCWGFHLSSHATENSNHVLIAYFFLVRNNIPLSGCATVYLSIHLLKDIFLASQFWQTSVYRFLCGYKFSTLSGLGKCVRYKFILV